MAWENLSRGTRGRPGPPHPSPDGVGALRPHFLPRTFLCHCHLLSLALCPGLGSSVVPSRLKGRPGFRCRGTPQGEPSVLEAQGCPAPPLPIPG